MTITMTAAALPAGPRASRLPGPDLEAIKADETAKVDREFARLRDPETIARRAAAIIADAEQALEQSEKLRDAAAMSLHVYHRTRGLARLTGLSPMAVYNKRIKANEANTPYMADAADVLVEHAEKAARALWRRRAAMKHRDAALQALAAAGWTKAAIAAIIGRNPSRVSHIAGEHQDGGE